MGYKYKQLASFTYKNPVLSIICVIILTSLNIMQGPEYKAVKERKQNLHIKVISTDFFFLNDKTEKQLLFCYWNYNYKHRKSSPFNVIKHQWKQKCSF